MKPVAVTGLGVVSPFGAGVKPYWEGISSGACGQRLKSRASVSDDRGRKKLVLIWSEAHHGAKPLSCSMRRRAAESQDAHRTVSRG